MEQSMGETIPLLLASNSNSRTTPAASKTKRFGGILLALLATFIYSLATLILKSFHTYHPFTVSIWRFQGMIIPSIPVILLYSCLRSTKERGYAKTFGIGPGVHTLRENLKIIFLIFVRSFVGCTSTILQIYAVDRLNLADASVIVFSSPVFVTLFAHCFLGEKAGWSSVLIAILTFVGVVIISRPPILTGQGPMDGDTYAGILFAIGSMLLATVVIIILRFLREVHYSIVTISYGILGSIECVTLAAIYGVLELPHGAHEWTLAVGLILFTFLGQTFLILALKFEQAGPVALLQSTDVIFSFILQFIFLGVSPDGYSILGASIVILGVSLTTIRKSRQSTLTSANERPTE